MNKQNNIALIIAIIFASAAISGSLVFFGMQVSGKAGSIDWDKFVVKVGEGLDAYVKKQQQQAQQAQQQNVAQKETLAQNVGKYVSGRDHLRGNPNAEITLYEYSDYVCPYCARFHQTAKQMIEQYGGKVNWVYRHWPLPGHDPIATMAAQGGECVNEMGGNDKFWAYTDAVFEKIANGENVSTLDDLVVVAKNIGVNDSKFKSCVENNKYLDRVKSDISEGDTLGVNGTPGNIFVSNKNGTVKVLDGAQPMSEVQKLVNSMLK